MDSIKNKLVAFIQKYKYAALIVLIGLGLMLMPIKKENINTEELVIQEPVSQRDLEKDLENILSKIDGAGNVEVILTLSKGEHTYYQFDTDETMTDNSAGNSVRTVIVSDSSKNEHGIVTRVDPAQYLGAVILCQGAERSTVRLAIIDAVAKATGLGADRICVLKMK